MLSNSLTDTLKCLQFYDTEFSFSFCFPLFHLKFLPDCSYPLRDFVQTYHPRIVPMESTTESISLSVTSDKPPTSFASWCETVFAIYKRPCQVVMDPAGVVGFKELGHIINSYETTVLGMDLIGFKPVRWADEIVKSALVAPGRQKPLFATVSGCGRGKTRACTEIRNVLLKRGRAVSYTHLTLPTIYSV